MTPFSVVTLALWAAIIGSAALLRRGAVVYVVAIIGLVYTSISLSLQPQLGWPMWLTTILQVFAFVPFLRLKSPALRPPLFHVLVSLPGAWWFAGTLLGFPWAIASAIGYPLPWPWLPFALATFGLVDSLLRHEEVVDVVLDGEARSGELPLRYRSPDSPKNDRPLRIVQITDPHLGPFMSEKRLAGICARAVEREPDLIVLTGDFLTIESNRDPHVLARALAPLAVAKGRTFACLGNHDHEALDTVQNALKEVGVCLLVDEAVVVDTAVGPVQIVGADFRRNERAAHLGGLVAAYPRVPGAMRLVLLHDPGAFTHLPAGEGDLVLSGHTHGGQLGLLRFGLPHTVVSALTKIPDHGLWARGTDRLYVHRGTGHYGFPLRIGVPTEQSLLQVHLPQRTLGK